MIALYEDYRVDDGAGNRRAVVLPLAVWRGIKVELEERDDIRVDDAGKVEPSAPLSFESPIHEKSTPGATIDLQPAH